MKNLTKSHWKQGLGLLFTVLLLIFMYSQIEKFWNKKVFPYFSNFERIEVKILDGSVHAGAHYRKSQTKLYLPKLVEEEHVSVALEEGEIEVSLVKPRGTRKVYLEINGKMYGNGDPHYFRVMNYQNENIWMDLCHDITGQNECWKDIATIYIFDKETEARILELLSKYDKGKINKRPLTN